MLFLRQTGTDQQPGRALPGDGNSPEGIGHLFPDFTGGGVESFRSRQSGTDCIPGRRNFIESRQALEILLPDGQTIQPADDTEPSGQEGILLL